LRQPPVRPRKDLLNRLAGGQFATHLFQGPLKTLGRCLLAECTESSLQRQAGVDQQGDITPCPRSGVTAPAAIVPVVAGCDHGIPIVRSISVRGRNSVNPYSRTMLPQQP